MYPRKRKVDTRCEKRLFVVSVEGAVTEVEYLRRLEKLHYGTDLFHSEFSLESAIFNDIGISGAPINDAIRAPENETINETIKNSPGISLLGLVARTKKSRATVARTIAKLRSEGKVEYRGSKKTGGYYLK